MRVATVPLYYTTAFEVWRAETEPQDASKVEYDSRETIPRNSKARTPIRGHMCPPVNANAL